MVEVTGLHVPVPGVLVGPVVGVRVGVLVIAGGVKVRVGVLVIPAVGVRVGVLVIAGVNVRVEVGPAIGVRVGEAPGEGVLVIAPAVGVRVGVLVGIATPPGSVPQTRVPL